MVLNYTCSPPLTTTSHGPLCASLLSSFAVHSTAWMTLDMRNMGQSRTTLAFATAWEAVHPAQLLAGLGPLVLPPESPDPLQQDSSLTGEPWEGTGGRFMRRGGPKTDCLGPYVHAVRVELLLFKRE